MKKYITLVFKCETDEELQDVRDMATSELCRAWSEDHEIQRLELIELAMEKKDFEIIDAICGIDGVASFKSVDDVKARYV